MSTRQNIMRVVIVGCGNIARVHADFLMKFKKATIVGVCDKSIERARTFSENYSIAYYTGSLTELLDECSPDVVHVLTPTSTHAKIALLALNHGCHVLVEKPLCSSVQEGGEIRKAVKESGKCCVVNHSLLGDPIYQKGKKLIEKKFIGEITHVDFLLSDDYLLKYKKGISRNWVSDQTLGVFNDLLPHPLYLLQNLMGNIKVKNVFSKSNDESFPTFLKIDFESDIGSTATLTLSLQIFPIQQKLHVYGDTGNILIDYRNFYTILEKNISLPQPLPRFISNLSKSRQYLLETVKNYFGLIIGKIHPYKGLRNVIENFYSSIKTDKNLAPTIEDGIKVVETIHEIEQWFKNSKDSIPKKKNIISTVDSKENSKPTILVTGATGLLGLQLVKKLIEKGGIVRVFCRVSSDISNLPSNNIEIVYGDMRDIDENENLLEGIDTVYHCASAMRGSWFDHHEITVEGTRKLLDICNKKEIVRFIHISSMGILNYSNMKNGQSIDETSQLEKYQDKRGFYTKAKLLQEELVKQYINNSSLNITIIRPGIIIDPGNPQMLTDVGFMIKNIILHIGVKKRKLRLINIHKLVDYILKSSDDNISLGQTYNVIENEAQYSTVYVNTYIKPGQKIYLIRVPLIFFIIIFGSVDFLLSKLPGQEKRFLVYKLNSMVKSLNYDTSLINSVINK